MFEEPSFRLDAAYIERWLGALLPHGQKPKDVINDQLNDVHVLKDLTVLSKMLTQRLVGAEKMSVTVRDKRHFDINLIAPGRRRSYAGKFEAIRSAIRSTEERAHGCRVSRRQRSVLIEIEVGLYALVQAVVVGGKEARNAAD